jgi:tRNA dimethylallyltransferase
MIMGFALDDHKIKNLLYFRSMTARKYLIVVGGPTASGKTGLAIRLARHFQTGVISGDSRQFYREMNIGTAKPSDEELQQAPHYFINSLSIEQDYSAGNFERDGLQLLEQLFREKDIVVMAGGSGLYIKALCEGFDPFPEAPLSVRREVELQYETEGIESLREALRQADPEYYREVDLNNPHRLIRALAVIRASGRPFSEFRTRKTVERPFTPIYLQLSWPRGALYERINRRVDQMIKTGLIEEARGLYPQRRLTALQTVGYQELFDHFEGKTGFEEAVNLVKQNSRRYAKRQLTWMRRDGFWKHLRPDDWDLALKYIGLAQSENLHLAKPAKDDWPEISAFLSLNNPSPTQDKSHSATVFRDKRGIASAIVTMDLPKVNLLACLNVSAHLPKKELELLTIHEAILAVEENHIYALVQPDQEPSFFEIGFSPVSEDSLSPGIRLAADMVSISSSGARIMEWKGFIPQPVED